MDERSVRVAEGVLRQLHEHFRDNHRKRDQIIAFFTAAVAGLIAGWKDLGELRGPVCIGVAVLGIFLVLVMLRYRVWHIRYVNSIVLFEHLLSTGKPLTLETVMAVWKKVNDTLSVGALLNPFTSVESGAYFGFASLVGLTFHLAVSSTDVGLPSPFSGYILPLLTNVAVVVLFACFFAWKVLPHAQDVPKNDWMFRWLRDCAESS